MGYMSSEGHTFREIGLIWEIPVGRTLLGAYIQGIVYFLSMSSADWSSRRKGLGRGTYEIA
jgi:hypothetical protein